MTTSDTTTAGGAFLSPTEAGVRMGKCDASVRRYIRDGRLKATRDPLTGRLKIRAADVDALLSSEPAVVTATN
jgi:hypothetical protein